MRTGEVGQCENESGLEQLMRQAADVKKEDDFEDLVYPMASPGTRAALREQRAAIHAFLASCYGRL